MRTFGLYLIILSIISIVLALIGLEIPVISRLDTWGLPKGLLIRVSFLLIGFFLMASHKEKLPEEQFPELKEINSMSENEMPDAETSASDAI